MSLEKKLDSVLNNAFIALGAFGLLSSLYLVSEVFLGKASVENAIGYAVYSLMTGAISYNIFKEG